MKILISIVFINYSICCFTQNFAPIGAKWHFGTSYMWQGEGFVSFESLRDTIISTKNCSILHQNASIYCSNRPLDVAVYEEDSVVYYWDDHRQMFQTLYDFTKQIGEGWQLQLTNFFNSELDTFDLIVTGRSMTQFGLGSLLTLNVDYHLRGDSTNTYSSIIYERIGDFDFMFNHQNFSIACDDGYSLGLRCYSDSLFGFYSFDTLKPCDFNSLSINENLINNTIVTYPNPVKDILTIESELEIEEYSIISILGVSLISQKFIYENKLSVSNLPNGIYFLNLKLNNETKCIRFEKQ